MSLGMWAGFQFARRLHGTESDSSSESSTESSAENAAATSGTQPDPKICLAQCAGTFLRRALSGRFEILLDDADIVILQGRHATFLTVVNEDRTEALLTCEIQNSGMLDRTGDHILWQCDVEGQLREFAFAPSRCDQHEGSCACRSTAAQAFVDRYNCVVHQALSGSTVPDAIAELTTAAIETAAPADPPRLSARRSSRFSGRAITSMVDLPGQASILTAAQGGALQFYSYDSVDGHTVTPDKPLAAPHDLVATRPGQAALLPDPESKAVAVVDLERGVVENYMPGLEVGIASLSLSEGRRGNPHLLVCSNPHQCFEIDTRLDPTKCAVVATGCSLTDYTHSKRDTHFLCHATSESGHLVVGDKAGQVRLFSGPPGAVRATGGSANHPKTAKTLIASDPSSPIFHVDVTSDGSLVVATCKQHLLIVRSKLADGTNGFTTRLGDRKPAPLKLLVPPGVAQLLKPDYTLTRASFAVNDDELIISTSAQTYSLHWIVKDVIKALDERSAVGCIARNERLDISQLCAGTNHVAMVDTSRVTVDQLAIRGAKHSVRINH